MRTQMRFILSIGALALLAAPAYADRGRNPLAGQPAIRHRVEMRKLRFEITPQFLVSANQPYLIGFGGGANIQFHITDWFGIGGSFHYTANVAAPLVGRIMEALPDQYAKTTDPAAGLKQPSKRVTPSVRVCRSCQQSEGSNRKDEAHLRPHVIPRSYYRACLYSNLGGKKNDSPRPNTTSSESVVLPLALRQLA